LFGIGNYFYVSQENLAGERIQAPYISVGEVRKIVEYIKSRYAETSREEECLKEAETLRKMLTAIKIAEEGEVEACYIEALKAVIEEGRASISIVARRCRCGYNKSVKAIEWMEKEGYVSAFDGSKARSVLITAEAFERKFGERQVERAYIDALRFVVQNNCASVFTFQRRLGLAYDEAKEMIEWMEKEGYVSTYDGKNPRKVLLSREEFEEKFGE
jgi:DNA segregation ATPase FtsK/SpoIIIE-like protein